VFEPISSQIPRIHWARLQQVLLNLIRIAKTLRRQAEDSGSVARAGHLFRLRYETRMLDAYPVFKTLRLPVIGAPLFIISGPDLVIAQCKAGIVGAFPALNARPQALLDEWLHRITEELSAWNRDNPDIPAAPFAVNQIVHKSNDRLEADLATCAKWQVPIVITSLGAREDLNTAVHGWGGITLHDVIDDRFARKAIEKGADGLIAVAAGAGGHAGRLSPFALVQEIRDWFTGPLALSGAIANGGAILAAQAMGADFAYIGSPFIATDEANAMDGYKQGIVEGRAADIVYSNLFTGVHGNYLRGSISAAGLDPDNLPEGDLKTMNFGGNEGSKAKAWRDIWGSGQGIGAVKAVEPIAERVARLTEEYRAARARMTKASSAF
jgi:nitronate monooxygenase